MQLFKLVTSILIPFTICSSAFGQDPSSQARQQGIEVTGIIQDEESGDPLEFAAVSVLHKGDSSIVSGGVTDIDGRFSLRVQAGTYLVKIEYISYETRWVEGVTLEPGMESYNIGEIQLGVSGKVLDEVVVTGEKSQFQLGLDKRIYNVEKDLVTRSGSAIDVLDNIPSVAVDLDGNVSLRGSDNVRILIDGRPSGLVGMGGSDGLRSLQGDMIERVEVITNPSARYDAEGMAGIINIVLKKDRRAGVNGTFSVFGGYPANHGLSAGANFRKNKVNLFANVGVRYRKNPGGGDLYQEYYNGDTTTYLEQTNDRERGGWSYNGQFGIDYLITPNSTLTGSFLYDNGDEQNESTVVYNDFNQFYELVSITTRKEFEHELEPNFQYTLNFRHQFDGNDDHELSAVVQHDDSEETEDADYIEEHFMPDGSPSGDPNLYQHRLNIEGQKQWLAQVDYFMPVISNGKFETGYRFTSRDITNDFLVEELEGSEWEEIPELSNDFVYDEKIHAGYLIFGQDGEKFDYQVGLRAEYTDLSTQLLETNEINDRDYMDFFPSAHLGYTLKGQNSMQLSYSRRIDRPHYRMLNPFSSFSDARNIWAGNPNLNPEYTHSVELAYLKYWESASLSSSVYYRHTDDVIERIRRINDEGITITTPENLATDDQWGFEFTFTTDISKVWRIDGNVNLFRQITRDSIYGSSDTYSTMGRLNSRLLLFDFLETQLRLNYRGPRQTPQGRSKSMFYADLAMSADILNNKATVTFSINDIFNTRKYRYIREGEGFYSDGTWQWRSTTATLTFTYRLNQKKARERDGERGEFNGGDMDFGG